MINIKLNDRRTLRNQPYKKVDGVKTIDVAGRQVDVHATYAPTEKAYHAFVNNGITPQFLHEIRDADAFHDAIKAGTNKFSSSVEVKSPEELAKGRMFVTTDGKAGATIHGDYIGGAFNHNPEHKGFAHAVVPLLTQLGGRRADAFDTVLPSIYAQHGLHTVSRVKFNDEYAPKNWDYNLYSKYNSGRPDVNLLSYQHDNFDDYHPGQGMSERHDDYDMAEIVQARSVRHPVQKTFSDLKESFYPFNFKPEKGQDQTYDIHVKDTHTGKKVKSFDTFYQAHEHALKLNREYAPDKDIARYAVPFHDKVSDAYHKEANAHLQKILPNDSILKNNA